MKALVSVHYHLPPCQMLTYLPQAYRVDRLLTITGKGDFALNVPSSAEARGVLQEGAVILIRSTTGMLPYVGVVQQTLETAEDIEVSGDNYASVLYGMAINRTMPVPRGGAGKIAAELLRSSQSMGNSIFLPVARATGSVLLEDFDFGAQYLGEALDALADRTDDEWWTEHLLMNGAISHKFYWENRRGHYRPNTILQEGKDFTSIEFKRDVLGRVRTSIVVGGRGPIAERESAAVSKQTGLGSGKATVTSFEPVLVPNTNPLASKDLVQVRPLERNHSTLATMARRGAMQPPRGTAKSFEITALLSSVAHLSPGDVCQLRTYSFGGLQETIRIMAMQPDESTGECDLEVEVQGEV